jgi:tRNA nucleotidyltransferase (CCA-adding enzyme)
MAANRDSTSAAMLVGDRRPPATGAKIRSVLLERFHSLPAAQPLLEPLRERSDVHLVGGAVRDLLLGGAPADLDLVVEGDVASFAESLGGEIRRYDRFGTYTVSLEGRQYDIARARSERYPEPGALPEVSPASLDQDLRRRDFTVNAIALALGGPQAGELHAVEGARADLDARQLRILHDRSFTDDPTRLLRLARYTARLGFEIEPRTLELAREAISGGALGTVSDDRIEHELRLLAREPDPVAALQAAQELGIPDVREFDADLAHRALELLPADGDRVRLLLMLAADAKAGRELGRALEAAHRPSEIAEAIGDSALEELAAAGARGPREQAQTWVQELRHVRLGITGRELLQSGVPEGPLIGAGLKAALAAKLDGRVHGREQELAEALRAARPTRDAG